MLNNLELALDIEILQSLKTLEKVRLKYRMFCGLIARFVEVTGEKLIVNLLIVLNCRKP